MAAMLRPQPQIVPPQPQPVAYVDPEAEKRRLLEEEAARKIEEERIRVENEKREALKFENMLKAQEEQLRKREGNFNLTLPICLYFISEELRLKEMTFLQQQDMLRKQEEEILKQEEAELEAQRAKEEAQRKAAEEEEQRQLAIRKQQVDSVFQTSFTCI